MAKRGPTPKPWRRGDTGGWYITLNGQQIPLGHDKRQADAEYHRLMVEAGVEAPGRRRITVRELVRAWLDDCEDRIDPDTLRSYRGHAESFADKCGGMPASEVRVLHVNGWLKGRKCTGRGREGEPLSRSTRHLAITVVKMVMEWGEYAGHLASNPIRRIKRPGIERRRPITMAEAKAVMAEITPGILVALEVMLLLGVRPGELCSMAAEKIDLAAGKAIVKCKRTRRNKAGVRTVYLPDVAIPALESLVRSHPSGAIFFCKGGPLRPLSLRNALASARARACRKLGLEEGSLDHVKPHCFRGLFATEALRRRVDAAMVAMALGQSDPRVLMDHYAAPDDEMKRDVANRAVHTPPSSPDTRPGTPE